MGASLGSPAGRTLGPSSPFVMSTMTSTPVHGNQNLETTTSVAPTSQPIDQKTMNKVEKIF
jgi:hypothetical protein